MRGRRTARFNRCGIRYRATNIRLTSGEFDARLDGPGRLWGSRGVGNWSTDGCFAKLHGNQRSLQIVCSGGKAEATSKQSARAR